MEINKSKGNHYLLEYTSRKTHFLYKNVRGDFFTKHGLQCG